MPHVDNDDVLGSVTYVLPIANPMWTRLVVDPSNSEMGAKLTPLQDDFLQRNTKHLPRTMKSEPYGAGKSACWGTFSRLPHTTEAVPMVHKGKGRRVRKRLCLTLYADERFTKSSFHRRFAAEDRRRPRLRYIKGSLQVQCKRNDFRWTTINVNGDGSFSYPQELRGWKLPSCVDGAYLRTLKAKKAAIKIPCGARETSPQHMHSRSTVLVPYVLPAGRTRSGSLQTSSHCTFLCMMNAVSVMPQEYVASLLQTMELDLQCDRLKPTREQQLGSIFNMKWMVGRYLDQHSKRIRTRRVKFNFPQLRWQKVIELGKTLDTVLLIQLNSGSEQTSHAIATVGSTILDCVENESLPLTLASLRVCAGGVDFNVAHVKQLFVMLPGAASKKMKRKRHDSDYWNKVLDIQKHLL